MNYPAGYEEGLFRATGLAPGGERAHWIAEALRAINASYQGESSLSLFRQEECLRAYTLYYMSLYLPKLWFVLERCGGELERLLSSRPLLVPRTEIPGSALRPKEKPLTTGSGATEATGPLHLPEAPLSTVTELGSGPGTFLWALLFYLRERKLSGVESALQFIGIDLSAPALAMADRLKTEFAPAIPARFTVADWRTLPQAPGDLLIFGHTLIEGEPLAAERVVKLCCEAKMVIFIEPGTREAFHRLLPLRDRLLAEGWNLVFPCPTGKPCPMSKENWCHFAVGRERLPFLQRLSGGAEWVSARSTFTAFVFSRTPPAEDRDRWRVLSRVKKAGGRASRYLCNGSAMLEAWLGRKERSESNHLFLKADPGDGIILSGTESSFLTTPRLREAMQVKSDRGLLRRAE